MIKISKEAKVGVFAFVGIAVLIIGYNFLKGYSLLEGHSKYYVVYRNVEGIVKSTQVSINGLKVGQIENIEMLHKGDASNILVTLMVNSDIQLPRGTKATISSQDLLGTKVIAVTLSQNSEILESGDTLVAGMEESLSSTISGLVSPLKEKSEQVLVTLDRVLQSMNDVFDSTGTQRLANGINDFSGSLHHIRNISERFDKLTEEEYDKIKIMLANVEAISTNLKNNNEAITKTLKNFSHITDSFAASNLTATINNTNRVMSEFAFTLAKINRGEGSLGKLANDQDLYNNLNKTSVELTALMKDMQDYPGRYFSVSVFGGGSRAEKQDKKREDEKKKKGK
jgi:phospholipid/cholesterol/gamma-HCH transport system substrate-binding protein